MFEDREEAGQLLADELTAYRKKKDVVVVGIPRGGVPVASKIAKTLDLPLDVVVTRKIGAPGREELAIGAIGPGGVRVFDKDLIKRLSVDDEYKENAIKREKVKIRKRVAKFRKGKKEYDYKSKTVILVDDGIATGATIEAAVKYLGKKEAGKIILAVPVAPLESVEQFKSMVDEFISLKTPKEFYAVGQFYRSFPQTTDEEVIKLLQ